MAKETRNITFDVARALCMLWIVGFWHLADYYSFPKNPHGFGLYLTHASLACFVFISGFFIGKKDTSPKIFYLARLKRFYPLFFLSCSTLYILFNWFENDKHFLLSVTGLSCFFLPQPKTIWFLCMMIVFYAITPFLASKKIKLTAIKGFLCLLLFYLVNIIHPIDLRVPMYFVFYLIGLFFPFSLMESILKKISILFPTCLVSYVALFFIKNPIIEEISILLGIFLILIISKAIVSLQVKKINKVFEYIAYASMGAYLFHRHVYIILNHYLHFENLFSKTILAFSCLCAAILAGGGAQRIYDIALSKITKENKIWKF